MSQTATAYLLFRLERRTVTQPLFDFYLALAPT